VADEFETRVVEEMKNICLCPGEKIVDADDVIASREQAFAEMRSEKSGTTRD
jgi:hypothetical protein